MFRESGGINRGGGDDHAQIWAFRQELFQVAEEEVNVKTAFVRLVDNDGVVTTKLLVMGEFIQQDAVGHELDPRGLAGLIREANLIADEIAEFLVAFLRDALRYRARGEASRLGVGDAFAPSEETDLRQLGGFTRPGLTRHHNHLVVPNELRNVLRLRGDGKVGRDGECRHAATYSGHSA